MSRFDEEMAQPTAPRGSANESGGFFSKMASSLKTSPFSAADADSGITPTAKELERKERELQELEAKLKRKEEELQGQENRYGVEHKNFPPFMPLIHHDIQSDIAENRRPVQYAAFWSWMGIMICLFVNFIGAIASWIAGTFTFTSGIGNFFLALIYLICGVPLSFLLWYRPLYVAMRKDGMVSFTFFFISYAVHIAFCIFATIAPPFLWHGYSFTGWMSGFDILLSGWTAVGIIYLVGAGLFSLETALSVYTIGRVYAHFRHRA